MLNWKISTSQSNAPDQLLNAVWTLITHINIDYIKRWTIISQSGKLFFNLKFMYFFSKSYNLPVTFRLAVLSTVPARFLALRVYWPASSGNALVISRLTWPSLVWWTWKYVEGLITLVLLNSHVTSGATKRNNIDIVNAECVGIRLINR